VAQPLCYIGSLSRKFIEGSCALKFPSDVSLRFPFPAVDARPSAPDSRLQSEVVALFDEMRDRLLRYLLCLGVPVHEGEEIAQEVFLLLFEHLQDGKSRENLRGWLFSVTRNLAFKWHRENRTSLRRAVPFEEDLDGLQWQNEANPEQLAYIRQRQKHLWAVVRALPERDQICLFLRADGLRYREIGEAMGISLGSVAASLARSLAKLARADGGSI
jgi:RNA polymerase sigma-70 factor, ECF subfamily